MPSLAHKQRLLTVDEYHAMARAGILTEDDRVELIDGKIITMSPVGGSHIACVNRLNRLFHHQLFVLGDTSVSVSVQNPVQLGRYGEPEPDVALLGPASEHPPAVPGVDRVLLLVEVSDTSLDYDHTVKVPRYAAAGIPEVWIVALSEEHIEVYRNPTTDGYAERLVVSRGEALAVEALPLLGRLAVADVLAL